jgi:hypothetical protein
MSLRSPPVKSKHFQTNICELTHFANFRSSYCLPKAVHQLAWRPVARDGADRPYELAIAGEDSSLRVYAFSQAYFQVSTDSYQ